MQRFFREFEQLDAGAARRLEETGLGLAFAQKLVEFPSGAISVKSEYVKGSAFSVTMPRVIAEVNNNE
jgi:signal transduction histidine kinase